MLKVGVETGSGSTATYNFVEMSTNFDFWRFWSGILGPVSEVILARKPINTTTGSYGF
mgnify:FL=1